MLILFSTHTHTHTHTLGRNISAFLYEINATVCSANTVVTH